MLPAVGDFTTAPCTSDAEAQRSYEAPAARVLDALAGFGRPVYFVPGNHDPLSLFNHSERSQRQSPLTLGNSDTALAAPKWRGRPVGSGGGD